MTEKRIEERARAVVENCIERRNGNASKTCSHICLTSNLEVLQCNTFVFSNSFSSFSLYSFHFFASICAIQLQLFELTSIYSGNHLPGGRR